VVGIYSELKDASACQLDSVSVESECKTLEIRKDIFQNTRHGISHVSAVGRESHACLQSFVM
jgi:hypothetical protein